MTFTAKNTQNVSVPLLTVVVPCHNCQSTVGRLISTISGQTRQTGWNAVLVDDHSTDHTMELLHRNATVGFFRNRDERFTIINNPGRGAGSARNAGMKLATGRFLWFMDSDDYLCGPDVFSRMFDMLEKNPDVDLFHVNCLAVTGNGRPVKNNFVNLRVPRELCDKPLTSGDFVGNFKKLYPVIGFSPWNKVVRRDFLKQTGITFQNTPFCNDQCFSVRVMMEAKTMYMDSGNPVYCWLTEGRFHLTYSRLKITRPDVFEQVLTHMEHSCKWPNDEIRNMVMDDRRVMFAKSSGRTL